VAAVLESLVAAAEYLVFEVAKSLEEVVDRLGLPVGLHLAAAGEYLVSLALLCLATTAVYLGGWVLGRQEVVADFLVLVA